MKYYSYNYYDPTHTDSGYIETKSENEIIEEYHDWWYQKMIAKFGKDYVDNNYCKLDCINDWVNTNWAWEVLNK